MHDVVLIGPRIQANESRINRFLVSSPGYTLASVKAAAEESNRIKVKVIDDRCHSLEDTMNAIEKAKAVVFSAKTPQLPRAEYLAQKIKEKYPDKKLIIGGLAATLNPKGIYKNGNSNFDIIITGRGDEEPGEEASEDRGLW